MKKIIMKVLLFLLLFAGVFCSICQADVIMFDPITGERVKPSNPRPVVVEETINVTPIIVIGIIGLVIAVVAIIILKRSKKIKNLNNNKSEE